MVDKGHVPFLDFAYQGFGDGIDADAAAVRLFAAGPLPCLVASSFSKSFSLYGERVGALSMVLPTQDEAQRVLSQLKRVVRANYSNPPTHGGAVVSAILSTPDLRACWEEELAGMRARIKQMREELVRQLEAAGVRQDFSFVAQATRHVLVLRPHQRAGRPAARGPRDLCHLQRPHLRRGAERRATSSGSRRRSPRSSPEVRPRSPARARGWREAGDLPS